MLDLNIEKVGKIISINTPVVKTPEGKDLVLIYALTDKGLIFQHYVEGWVQVLPLKDNQLFKRSGSEIVRTTEVL